MVEEFIEKQLCMPYCCCFPELGWYKLLTLSGHINSRQYTYSMCNGLIVGGAIITTKACYMHVRKVRV